ncbi:MAG: hypothetical protein JSV91_00035 [Phycisphaerales bacterium]|nr:MAG: hypothetical protein JSV91_00035 [Phycisphaerales bacterium]
MNARSLLLLVMILLGAGGAGQDEGPDAAAPLACKPPAGTLAPIPATGRVPPMVETGETLPEDLLRHRARVRKYAQQIRALRRECFGSHAEKARRAEGIRRLKEFTDPAAFRPLIRELAGENDDVRLAVLDHLASRGEEGQGGLAFAAIYQGDAAIRNEATTRMVTPPTAAVLVVLDEALRSPVHEVANNAGSLAGTLNVLEAIPLLIFGQVTTDRVARQGDLAWIAVQTQTAYVQRLEAVTGSGAGAYQPVMGIVNEGSVLRIVDAVAYFYRTEVHRVLVGMTTADWGHCTEDLGYDMYAWWKWYNEVYVPFKNEKAAIEALAGELAEAGDSVSQTPPGGGPP